MKKRNLLILAGALLFILFIELSSTGTLSSLQGRLENLIHESGLRTLTTYYTLDSSSPSGTRSAVSTSDVVFIFNASGGRGIPSGTEFEFYFTTDEGDINSTFDMSSISVYHEGTEVMGGTIDALGTDSALAVLAVDERIPIDSGGETFTVSIDTVSLLEEDIGENDPLDITMTVNGQDVEGNTLNY